MVIENTVSSDLRSMFIDCSEPFPLPPIRCDKGAYFMVIEIVWSFLHKALATISKLADDVLERAQMAMKPSAAMF